MNEEYLYIKASKGGKAIYAIKILEYIKEYRMHWITRPDYGAHFVCEGEGCRFCEYDISKKKLNKKGMYYGRYYHSQIRYNYKVTDMSDGKIKILDINPQVYTQISSLYPLYGSDLIIVKTSKTSASTFINPCLKN
jgi:hypothetical protein